MSTPPQDVLALSVVLLNIAYGVLLGVRVAVTGAFKKSADGGEAVASRHVTSNRAASSLILISLVAAVYYGGLIAWLAGLPVLGPRVMEISPLTFGAGIVLSLAGLMLMGWTYAIFRSWRWRAEVAPGHELITGGPFRLVRHPIYLSFALFYVGAFFLLPYALFLFHAIASFAAYDYRARAEEGVLLEAFGDDYRAYRVRTSRFVPRIY